MFLHKLSTEWPTDKDTKPAYDSLFSQQSVFGKGLTTILNEYVAAKTKGKIFWYCSHHYI